MAALYFFPNLVRDGPSKLPQRSGVLQMRAWTAVFLRQSADDAVDGASETIVRMAHGVFLSGADRLRLAG